MYFLKRSRLGWSALPAVSLIALLVAACNSSPTSSNDDVDLDNAVTLEGSSTLLFAGAEALAPHRARIEQIVRETVRTARRVIPLEGVTIVVRAGTADVIREIGFGGRADSGTVRLTFDPASSVLAANLDAELLPLLAHELHHVARIRTIGYGDNLLGAMVSEGLADQFSVEIAGVDPPIWSKALTPRQITTWTQNARQQWLSGTYDHAAWFFGNSSIPRWTGYTIGFELTGAYLAANPGSRASDLVGEPASSFVPQQP